MGPAVSPWAGTQWADSTPLTNNVAGRMGNRLGRLVKLVNASRRLVVHMTRRKYTRKKASNIAVGDHTRKVEFRELEATGFGVGARGTSGNLVVPRAETPIRPSEKNRGKNASKAS